MACALCYFVNKQRKGGNGTGRRGKPAPECYLADVRCEQWGANW